METIDETAIINQAPLPNQGIPEHESFTPSTDDCRRDTIRLVDELHDSANISDELWTALHGVFSVDQIFELIALVGFYHTVSFFANGLKIPLEPYGAPFPD